MYVTADYYTTTYGGTLISQNIDKALATAERSIDHLCYGRIKGKGFNNLSPYQQLLIKDAICLQVDYIEQYGAYITSPLKSYSAGKTSVQLNNVTYSGIATTQEIVNLLEDTGLRCRVL